MAQGQVLFPLSMAAAVAVFVVRVAHLVALVAVAEHQTTLGKVSAVLVFQGKATTVPMAVQVPLLLLVVVAVKLGLAQLATVVQQPLTISQVAVFRMLAAVAVCHLEQVELAQVTQV
jgi:hypothetical protein